ncbi:MAG TPA: D-alanyl-D-alanine carboxypeptidase/D-alanyl-D-alanine-endopeptidase [Tepidisphaeraceae bacterium]
MRCAWLAVLAAVLAPAVARADLAGDVDEILRDKLLHRAELSIEIAHLGARGETTILYQHNSDVPRAPASNLKLVTTSAALEALGPDFKFRTYLLLRDDDLILIGDGDPTMGDAELLKKVGWDVDTVFKSWAEQLKKRGISAVRNVIVDDSVFDEEFKHPSWDVKQEHKRYVAQVGGVNLNANCLDFYVKLTTPGSLVAFTTSPATHYATIENSCLTGNKNAIWLSRQPGTNTIVLRGEADASNQVPASVTIQDPPMFAATVLAETVGAAGVKISGKVARDRTLRAAFSKAGEDEKRHWTVIGIHETPIASVLARANKDSMNLYAECLCKRLGFETSQKPGSWENGTAAVGAFLKRIGVVESQFKLIDGCGLSRENEVSAAAVVKVLEHDYRGKNSQAFFASLAIAGVDGTLEDRFPGSDLRGRVFAKSGYINNVSCLSGFVKAKDEQWYVFSILINNVPGGAKPLQEAIVKAIDTNCPAKVAGR